MRIGIDVGGTHTDAVLFDGEEIVATTKELTSIDVTTGVFNALEAVLSLSGSEPSDIHAVMLGTTQFTNAVVERRELSKVAVIRLGLPSGRETPPASNWPDDIAAVIGKDIYMAKGGCLYDGTPLSELDIDELTKIISDIKFKGHRALAISSVFSPMDNSSEVQVARMVKSAIPDIQITLSSEIGRLGILERENAAILNAALLQFAERVTNGLVQAVRGRGFDCPFFISQNDGTLMGIEFTRKYPALTFSSGPTNSMRGAARLTGEGNAIVVDIGGTTSDIGVLQDGFPRESNNVIEVGGVRTNFRMPDILAIGIGGGSLVSEGGKKVGPVSVGHRLTKEGLVFGGHTMTATDILVAAGKAEIGNVDRLGCIEPDIIANTMQTIGNTIDMAIEQMKPSSSPMPVILVGGGAFLLSNPISAASKVIRPKHAEVANAIGAAIAQVGGEVDRLASFRNADRDRTVEEMIKEATAKAVKAGANSDTIRVLDVEETPLGYMEEGSSRLKVKVVGDLQIERSF